MEIVGDPPLAPDDRPRADFQAAGPGYFATINLPIVTGRGFTDRDTGRPIVGIVNEAFVRRYLGGRDPIGMGIRTVGIGGRSQAGERGIVGVARQLLDQRDAPEPPAQLYVPLAQLPWADTYLAVQASEGQSGRSSHPSARQSRESTGTCRSGGSGTGRPHNLDAAPHRSRGRSSASSLRSH